jgi:hypothetical protein
MLAHFLAGSISLRRTTNLYPQRDVIGPDIAPDLRANVKATFVGYVR